MKRKLVLLTRQKLWLTAFLVFGIMFPLLVASYAVTVGDVTAVPVKMVDYISEAQAIKFIYPQGWVVRTEKYYSGEIKESVAFSSPDGKAGGFAQVLEIKKTIPEYYNDLKAKMTPGYDSLQFGQKVIGGKSGYLLAYIRGSGEGRIVAADYFFPGASGKTYRFSCFYPEKEAEAYAGLFSQIIKSYSFPVEKK